MRVVDIQRFCTHDGPGVRTTAFFKGCPLRCVWCHNPETQRAGVEIMLYSALCAGCGACVQICPSGAQALTQTDRYRDVSLCQSCGKCAAVCPTEACRTVGRDMTAAEVAAELMRDAAFYGDVGGVTLSGGEPLCAEGVVELLEILKRQGVHVVVETAGLCDPDVLRAAVPLVDVFYWDIKHTDPVRHKQYTGVDPAPILQNLALADSLGAVTRLRCLLVNGLTTDGEHFARVAGIYHSLSCCEGVQLLRYHPMGSSKARALGLTARGGGEWMPTHKQIKSALEVLAGQGVPVIIEEL